MRRKQLGLAVLMLVPLAGCQPDANKIAINLAAPPESKVALRPLETRQYATADEKALLSSATQTLQDLGFTISESSAEVGELSAYKNRDAHETGQMVGAVLMGALFGVGAMIYDTDQKIQVNVVTTPVPNSKEIELRVTFDRLIKNNREMTRQETVVDPAIYQEFFDKLSSSASLAGKQI